MTAWSGDCRVGFRPCSYDRSVFSPRVRAELPCRDLRAAGFQAGIVPPDGAGDYDVVVFQKAYEKRDLELAASLAARGTKVVFDLCDNHFYSPHPTPAHEARVERLRRMIAGADVVSVSTPELARLIDGKPTFVVDDALEVPPFGPRARRRAAAARCRRGPVRVVWQGQHGTRSPRSGLYSLAKIVPDLEELHQVLPLQLTVIGNSRDAFRSVLAGARFPTRYVAWRRASFAGRFAANDVCVIPVDLNPFTICKSNNRPVLALLLGVPVVADPVPSYEELADVVTLVRQPGGTWADAIQAYASDRPRAERHVAEGRRWIGATYTPERVVAQWSEVLQAALRSGATA